MTIDLNDSLDDILGGNFSSGPRPMPTDAGFARIREEKTGVVERCLKCHGTGQFRSYSGRNLGSCFACKGAGHKTFKNDATVRAANRAQVAVRAERKATSAWEAFAAAHEAEAAWIVATSPRWDFAASMKTAAEKYGDLSEGQMAAVRKGIVRDAERASQRAAAAQVAQSVSFPNIRAAFDAVVLRGAKKAMMTIGDVEISLASAHGRNPGALYVKDAGQYAGKMVGTTFRAAHGAAANLMARLIVIEADPTAAIKAQAAKTAQQLAAGEIETGSCGCCGRTLTDPVSIANGIGPICASKWGF